MSETGSTPGTGISDEDRAIERAAEARLRTTFKMVDSWRRSRIVSPVAGSALHDDDKQWPVMPTSQLVKVGLDVATDHLWALQTIINAKQYLTFAFRSILRTALVGATQAVWLLNPESGDVRACRARVLTAELYHRHGAYLNQLLRIDDPSAGDANAQLLRNTRLVRDHVRARGDEIALVRSAAGEKAKWNDTDAIRDAARSTFGAEPNAGSLVEECVSEWMAGSGAAHGLVWPMLGTTGSTPQTEADEIGRVVIEARGSVARVENSYMAAFHMANHGWDLLRRRSS